MPEAYPRAELVKPIFLSFLFYFLAIIAQTASDDPQEEEVQWKLLYVAMIGACSQHGEAMLPAGLVGIV